MSNLQALITSVPLYARHPARVGEVTHWWRDRRRTTIDGRTPWWPYTAIVAVQAGLPSGAHVFEFGGGGSTLWLLDQGAEVTCVENDAEWFGVLQQEIGDLATLRLMEPATAGVIQSEIIPGRFLDDYVNTIAAQPDASLDLVIVDGRARVACGLAAMSKVKPGGMLLLDDSNRPRYRELRDALAGWDAVDYRGLKPGGGPVCQTTMWTRR